MKKRKTFTEAVKKSRMVWVWFVTYMVVWFIAGFLLRLSVFTSTMNEEQAMQCKQIAQDVYAQYEEIMEKAPDNFSASVIIDNYLVTISKTTVIVKPSEFKPDYVKAELQNNEPMIVHETDNSLRILMSEIIGLLFCLFGMGLSLVLDSIDNIKNKIKSKNVENEDKDECNPE